MIQFSVKWLFQFNKYIGQKYLSKLNYNKL